MRYITAVVIGFFVSAAGAGEFYLKHDASGTVYGPFQTDEGAQVAIGTTSFTVVKPTSATSAVETKLDEIKIPQVEQTGYSYKTSENTVTIYPKKL